MQAQFTRTEPYSLERLRKAIELFGKPKTPARDLRLLANLGDFTTTYNLRARSSQSNFIDVDVRDDDSDSDFQPTQGSKRKRRPREAQRTADVDSSATCLVTLSLSSVRGGALLLKLKHAEIFQDLVNSTDEDEEDEDANRDVEMGDGAVESPAVQGEVPMRYTTENVPTIETFFSHPIDCEMDINYSPLCEFCTDAGFGMFGLGLRTVEIIDHGNWYEELARGHRDEGREPTRMCNVCARRRLQIINCNRHQFSILHVCPSQGVGEASGQRNREQSVAYCSLCFNQARFRCSKIQEADIFDDEDEAISPIVQGCGLLLCGECKALMDAHCQDLRRVVAMVSVSRRIKRADADFLVDGSELNRYFSEDF